MRCSSLAYRALIALVLLCVVSNVVSSSTSEQPPRLLPSKRSYDTHHYYALEIWPSHTHISPAQAAALLGVEFIEQIGELAHHYLVRSEKPWEKETSGRLKRRHLPIHEDPILRRWFTLSQANRSPALAKRNGLETKELRVSFAIRSLERQELRIRHKRDKIISPWDTPHLFPQVRDPIAGPEPKPYPEPLPRPPILPAGKVAKMQDLHQINDPIFPEQWHLANDKRAGYDLNVSSVWAANITGKGVNVCLIDDGLDMKSPDLVSNFFAGGSYDFNAHTALPEPRLSDDQHGTRCAGEIAAIKNDVCGVGVAYEAHVAGVRILSGPIADVDEAAALNYAYQENHIYSCSWGPPDDGRSMDAPKGLIAKAILNGAQNGRGGKGSIFVFAGGNGGASDDQCNFDGYTNSIYSMTISAVDREGLHPYYSEMCAANIATGWSSGSGDHIHTTDVAWNGVNRCTSSHGGTSAAAPLVAGVIALALEVRPDLTWRDMQHVAVHSAVMINPEDPDWQKTQAGRHFNHKFGYGLIDAHAFVEEAKRHQLVKPQAWMTGRNVTIPKDESLLSEGGVKSTFVITEEMTKNANLESVEHVTVRVWITHERRGDVNIELTSPHGTKSVLARPRRYDDATTGFPGWGFMTLKHWDESPIGEWTMEVFDKAHPKKTGNFWAWSMTLWGQSIDPTKAIPWNFPPESIEYHETLAGAPSTTVVHLPPGGGASQLPKPTDHLPPNHGSAPGEDHQDFTNGTNISIPEADTIYLHGFKSKFVFAAAGVVVIFTASLAAFFVIRSRRSRIEKGAGDYEFVPGEEDDNVAMRTLERGGRKGGQKGTRTKELYDAFGEGSSEEDADELDERAGLTMRYKDDPQRGIDAPLAIDDEEEEEEQQQQRNIPKQTTGDLLFDASREEDAHESGSGGSGTSWQDVKES